MPTREDSPPKVFIVHGHDLGSLTRLELVLHRIGAEPITLRKLSSQSETWIELLEVHLPAAEAVVVLMTPDDEGRQAGSESLTKRVRENVLIEAGYAVIRNRKRSVLIALGGVEVPSDFHGIRQIKREFLDKTVEVELAKSLKTMGLAIDVSGAI